MSLMNLDSILAAAGRLRGVAHRTPIFHSRLLDEVCGGRVFLKAENLQRGGAFKFRGAYNALAANLEAAKARGVITASSGNHGGALALASSILGVRAVVVMPVDAPAVKEAAIRAYGAEVVKVGTTSEERLRDASERAAREGLLEIPPYDHPDVIAGQGTCALEIHEEVMADVVVACCGGGGLLAGTALAGAALRPQCETWGVETEAANDTWQSFQQRERVKIALPDTLADGMRNLMPGALTFPINLAHAKGIATVKEADLVAAMRFLFSRLKLVIEPTAAATVATFMTRAVDLRGRTGVAVLSGGNVDPALYARLLIESPT